MRGRWHCQAVSHDRRQKEPLATPLHGKHEVWPGRRQPESPTLNWPQRGHSMGDRSKATSQLQAPVNNQEFLRLCQKDQALVLGLHQHRNKGGSRPSPIKFKHKSSLFTSCQTKKINGFEKRENTLRILSIQ